MSSQFNKTENEMQQLGRCLVTGAAGFLGRNLVKALLKEGLEVVALQNRTTLDLEHSKLSKVTVNIVDYEVLTAAFKNIDTVFHTAALIALKGGRFAPAGYRQQAWQVNVDGTQNVIDACTSNKVQRLIYTSSVDVCFDHRVMPAMDESLPYAHNPKSVYAKTKIAAEKRVLAANGENLWTCAIRPDGIYGAEPNELIDRFSEQLIAGRLKARLGTPDAKQDNSHVINLVHGHLLAAQQLIPGGIACGQAYFISDSEPMNSFEFFRPLIEGLGFHFPTMVVPGQVLKPIVELWQAMHFLLKLPEPMLNPHELDKVVVTHYGSNEKARRDLGYEPKISVEEAMHECLDYCKKKFAEK